MKNEANTIIISIIIIAIFFVIGLLAGYYSNTSFESPSTNATESNTGNIGNQDVVNFFSLLSDGEKSCLENSLGATIYRDLSNSVRLPSPNEFSKIQQCTGLTSWPPGNFASLPSDYEMYKWEPQWEVNKR